MSFPKKGEELMKKRVFLAVFLFCAVLSLFPVPPQTARSFFLKEGGPRVNVSVIMPERDGESAGPFPLLVVLNAPEYAGVFSSILSVMADFGYAPRVILAVLETDNPFSIYTPSQAGIPGGDVISDSGGGPRLRELLIAEIIPWIEEKYPVSSYRLSYGHSVGGLWVLDDLINRDSLFSAHAATSPSCWWDDELLTRRVKREDGVSLKGGLFMCMGNEGETMLPPAKRFFEAVTQCEGDITAEFLSFETTDHQMIPVIAFSHSMAFLFSDWKLTEEIMGGGFDAVDQAVCRLNEKYGTHRKIPERFLNRLGYEALKQGDVKRALRLFSMNCTLYPGSANVWDSLGEAYEKNGQKEKALESYEERDNIKALENDSKL